MPSFWYWYLKSDNWPHIQGEIHEKKGEKQENSKNTNLSLKGLAQAKIMTVHRLELQKFLNFCAAHLLVMLDIETKFLISYFEQPCQK